MARNISTKFVIEGDKEYKNAVKQINAEMQVLKSEMSVVSSEFENQKNSIEALAAKGDVLVKMYDKQVEKVNESRKALENSQKVYEDITAELDDKNKKLAESEKQLEEYRNSTENTAEAEQALTSEIEKLKKEIADAESAQTKASKSVESWTKNTNYAQSEANKFKNQIDNNNSSLDKAKLALDKTGGSVENLGEDFDKTKDNAKKFGDTTNQAMDALSTVLAGAGVSQGIKEIATQLYDAYEASKQFNAGMAQTYTLLPGISDELKNETTASVLDFKTEMGLMGDTATQALYDTVSATGDVTKSLETLAIGQKAAIGGNTDLTSSVNGLTSVTNAYGEEVISTQAASDLMFTAVRLGKTTFNELSSSLYNVLPIASANSIEFQDITAAIAQMTSQGTPTAQATTQIRQALVELTDSGSQVSKTFEAVANQSFKEFIAQGGNTQEALAILQKEADRTDVGINELFSSVEAGSAAIALSGKNAGNYAEKIGEMEKAAGATDAAFEVMADSSDFAAKRFESAAETLQIAIGSTIEPALANLQNSGADAFEWAADFIEENPWLVGAVIASGAALAVLSAALVGYSLVTKAAAFATTTFTAALAANPIGILVVGLTALIAAIAGFTLAMGETNTELQDAKQYATETKQAFDDLNQTTNENISQNETNARTAEILTDRLKKLETQGLNTATAEAEYAATVRELNELMPELNLQIDENTGLLTESIDTIYKNIDALKEQAKAEIYYDQLIEATKKLAEAEIELEEASGDYYSLLNERNAAMTRMTQIEEAQRSSSELSREEMQKLNQEYMSLTSFLDSTRLSFLDLEETYNIHSGVVDNAKKSVDNAGSSYERFGAKIAAADGLVALASIGIGSITDKTEDMKSAIENSLVIWEEQYEVARENLDNTVGAFQDMTNDIEYSAEDLQNILQSQIDFFNNYGTNFETVMARAGNAMPEKFVAQLQDGSVESAAILDALANATDEEFNNIVASMSGVEKGKDNLATTMADASSEFQTEANKIKSSWSSTISGLNLSNQATSATAATMQAIINEVNRKKSAVESAYSSVASGIVAAYNTSLLIRSPSKKFEYSTDMTMDAVPLTVKKREAEVIGSYTELADKTVKNYSETFKKEFEVETSKNINLQASAEATFTQSSSTINKMAVSFDLSDNSLAKLDKIVEKIEELESKFETLDIADSVGTAVIDGMSKVTVNAQASIVARDASKSLSPEIDKKQGQSITQKKRGVI